MPGVLSDRVGIDALGASLYDAAMPLVTTSLLPLATAQAMWLLYRRVSFLPEPEGPIEGFHRGTEPPLRVVFVGDSSVVGVGVSHTDEAIGSAFARAWSQRTGQAVHWQLYGRYGATTHEILCEVVPRMQQEPVDLIVISSGTNDIMRCTPAHRYGANLRKLVHRVRDTAGPAPVVICQLPPLWCFPSLPEPLRTWASARRHGLDRHQKRASDALDRAHRLAGIDRVDPALFAQDGFHPGPNGYRYWGESMSERILNMDILSVS